MKVGDKCPYKVGFVVTEVTGKCPHHGCDTFVARDASGKHYFNFCVECRAEYHRKYNKSAYRRKAHLRYGNDYRHIHDNDREGIDVDYRESLWSYKADMAIEEFWRVRGMTDEDAIIKFGGHPKKKKPLASGRQKATATALPSSLPAASST